MVNHSKFVYFSGGTATAPMCAPSRNWVMDDTSSPYYNEPVDLEGPLVNREERRHGKGWQLPEMREEWKRRRG